MRIIPAKEIENTIHDLCIHANTHIPTDVINALTAAKELESRQRRRAQKPPAQNHPLILLKNSQTHKLTQNICHCRPNPETESNPSARSIQTLG